jgi:hypothetical protein
MGQDCQKSAKAHQSRIVRIGKMCKDKWNMLNFDFKKILNYHTQIGHHTSFWDLIMEKHDKHHLPRQFNKEFYNVIESI